LVGATHKTQSNQPHNKSNNWPQIVSLQQRIQITAITRPQSIDGIAPYQFVAANIDQPSQHITQSRTKNMQQTNTPIIAPTNQSINQPHQPHQSPVMPPDKPATQYINKPPNPSTK